MPAASTNCWTCKQRKVSCDRSLPVCLNCKKGRRECQGYGLRLAWPDKQDGRRKQKRYEVKDRNAVQSYILDGRGQFVFLNTTVKDFDGSKLSIETLPEGRMHMIPSSISKLLQPYSINEQDGMLLNHYDSAIARITTTIDDESNGFRLALMPMALSSTDLSSRSILHSTLAVASYHLGRSREALKYKFRAIKDLSDSFATLSMDNVDTATKTRHFAASMMLCVYGVFDESDTAWHMHLEGAKSVYEMIPPSVRSDSGFDFLKPWFQYHYIFSQYTYPPQGSVSDIMLPESTPESSRIIGVLGCSTEVLHLIGCTNQLHGLLHPASIPTTATSSPGSPSHSSPCPSLLYKISQMETRLLDLTQSLHLHPGATTGILDSALILRTAELYRLAAVLYFYQTIPSTFVPIVSPDSFLRAGLDILWEMKVCSSPWPLFILACSVSGDEERIRVLKLMEESGERRRIGNYGIVIGLVKAVWKRVDLLGGERERVDWRELVEGGGFMPSFI